MYEVLDKLLSFNSTDARRKHALGGESRFFVKCIPDSFLKIREFIPMFGETGMFSVDRINRVSLSCQLCVCLDADNQGKPVTSLKKAK